MTDYNDGNWHGWNGGECPVHPLTVIERVCQNDSGEILKSTLDAEQTYWSRDDAPDRGYVNIAFRVTKEHKEPREFWAKNVAGIGWVQCAENAGETVLFREVIE